ncbi:unnamed protein product [Amoebophrya sp. A25]|nr:unnamed protein product [Amoebophrya sp. A25]CAD7933149.1 unnamed protein product [Amoebophrya sp. A25]|eukprot:GSA25T00001357001.1
MPENDRTMTDVREVELREHAGSDPVVVGSESGLRKRADSGTSDISEALQSELPLPFSEYSKLDVLNQRERLWCSRLVVSSFLDIFVSFGVALTALSAAYKDVGVSLYCIGIQALAHCISSICCFLRFFRESKWGKYGAKDGRQGSEQDEEDAVLLTERRRDLVREQILSIGIACAMLLSSVALMFKAARKYRFWDRWYEDHQTQDESIRSMCEVLAWKSGALYFLHAGVRYLARADTPGHKFTNHIFWVSLVSSLYCIVLGISASYQKEWSWKAEPIAATIMSLGCVIEGIRICYVYVDDIDFLLTRHNRP